MTEITFSYLEKGRLLFEEKNPPSRESDRMNKIFGPVIIAMGIILFFIFLFGDSDDPGVAVVLSFIPLTLVVMGIGMLLSSMATRNVKIYERGIALPQVPIREIRKEEEFLLFDDIISIEIVDFAIGQGAKWIEIKTRKGEKPTFLGYSALSDPLPFLRAVEEARAELLGPEAKEVLKRDRPERRPPPAVEKRLRSTSGDMGMVVFMMLMYAFMFMIIGSSISFTKKGPLSVLVFVMLQGVLLIFVWGAIVHIERVNTSIWAFSSVKPDGLEAKVPYLLRLYTSMRDKLPFSVIKEIRHTLDPFFFTDRAEAILGDGRKIKIPYEAYQTVIRLPGWRVEGDVAINQNPKVPEPLRVYMWRIGITAFLGQLFLLALSSIFGSVLREGWESVKGPLAGLLIVVGSGVLIFHLYILSKAAKRTVEGSREPFVARGSVHIPRGEYEWDVYRIDEIEKICVRKDAVGEYCSLVVGGREKKLPLSYYRFFAREKGLPVESRHESEGEQEAS
ncbi:MAG: hypothetical protein J7L61_02975 [Thermoplasmata archaeon]|nr:hypothetical protein [Thermoplasmata archaeon]